ncbi:hypothetical protein Psuf_034490 [Phytohabitans suffuscus]|uniref:MacB-like periplasmic core domain-containing protein n=1 Tax=Phytohabitans suffuscus TaxID=624315 RepID=A0A6F8YJ78_9ACTN|nr:hypothetical protein Psuf_034490 [Phytohabitans suffuscus]
MGGVLWRVRVFAGQFGLLAALALVAALLITAAPRLANDLSDRALREDVARLPYAARDIVLEQRPDTLNADPTLSSSAGALPMYRDRLPAPLPGLVSQAWFTAGLEGVTLAPSGPRTLLGLRTQDGMDERVRLTTGRWPSNSAGAPTVEVALSGPVAEQLAAPVGTILDVDPTQQGGPAGVGCGSRSWVSSSRWTPPISPGTRSASRWSRSRACPASRRYRRPRWR